MSSFAAGSFAHRFGYTAAAAVMGRWVFAALLELASRVETVYAAAD